MGAQQSKPKQRSPNIKTLKQTTDNKKTTHTTPPIPNTKISLPPTNLQTPPLSPATTTPTTPPATITTTTTVNDNNNIKEQNMDDGHQITNTILNRFVEPPSLSINDYLDQHSATDFFVQDSPDFYDVQSTISSNYSQYTALFSNLSSSIASSSISSVSSLQPKLKSTLSSSNIQQWNEPTPATTTLVQDLANIKTMDDLLLFAEKNQHIELAYFVAVCYHNGGFNNNQIDIIKSIQWFEKAALLGDKMLKNNNEKENKSIYLPLIAKAQYRVGKLLLSHHHRDHHNEEENQKKAWQYIEMAAINENNKAEYLMGWKADKYENNFEKAIHWYISSWQHGLLEAQTALSCLLINHAHRLDDLTMNSIPGFTSDMSRDQLALSLLQDAADKVI
ncbi:hypothetical protein BJ944DRAFT_244692 [Cunninghamella echinulata]|nr:hypothetical protein BJ944DRAFT_244692 [Cunninghamella echinulata]